MGSYDDKFQTRKLKTPLEHFEELSKMWAENANILLLEGKTDEVFASRQKAENYRKMSMLLRQHLNEREKK